MALVVQKYGGTSVGDAERIRHVAARIVRRRHRGDDVVVVVSAMGNRTDELIDLALSVSSKPDPRELDLLLSTGEIVSITLLAMALRELGVEARSLTGAQAGIYTDKSHSRARIRQIDPERIREQLQAGRVVIVAGFQGATEDEDITTLGRGGSDTTAVAVAAALGADVCEIYTDVEGVFTTDPRIEPLARKLADISYEEMLELASYGAKVMAPRAVELGSVYNVPILVASSLVDASGTLIHGEQVLEERNKVRGIAADRNVAKITLRRVPDRPGIAAQLFEPLASAEVSVDTIVQNASQEALTDMTFTVSRTDLVRAEELMPAICAQVGAESWSAQGSLAKVSVVGTGIQNSPGYAARMFRALYDAQINIELITTSEIRLTCIIDEERLEDAVRALHRAFELESEGGV
jgi:aspartate kinase